ncbi:MAG TPA: ABC transporter permease [Spirochaetia bacterium]|nr:ABC transporter permease [Spirochaetia bacterium]
METSAESRSWPVSVNRLLILGVLAVMFLAFSLFAHNFFTVRSVLNLLIQTSTYTIVSMGAAFVMMVGGVDFSLGVAVIVAGHCAVWLTVAGVPAGLSMIAGIGLGGVMGFVNGIAVARLRIPAFLATMGTAMVAGGSLGTIAGYVHVDRVPESFGDLGNVPLFRTASFPGISWIVLIMFFLVVLLHFVATRTMLGRYCRLVGSNPQAARLSGIRVHRVKLAAFLLAGLLAGLAGILLASRAVTTPNTPGGYEIIGMACAMIGGASLSGGTGSIGGTVLGSFLLSTLAMGLTMLNSSGPTIFIFLAGMVVLLAVYLDQFRTSGSRFKQGAPAG